MNRKKALKIMMFWCVFHLFALVMSYSKIEIFNDGGRPQTENFWPFVKFVSSYETTLLWDHNHPKYGQRITAHDFNGIFLDYDWTEFVIYVGIAVIFFIFHFYLNIEKTSKRE